MADITHGTWIKDGNAVDAVYQSGVKVYGRNLALGTATPITLAGQNKVNQSQSAYQFSSVIPSGTVVTATFDIASSTGVGAYAMQFDGNDIGSNWQAITRDNLVKRTEHVSVTLTTSSVHFHIYTRLDNATGTITISNFVISKSSKEVSWTPAPEDVM